MATERYPDGIIPAEVHTAMHDEMEVLLDQCKASKITESEMKLKIVDVLVKYGLVPEEVYEYADRIASVIEERKLEMIFDGKLRELALTTGKRAEEFDVAITWTKFVLFDRGHLVHVGLEGDPSFTKYADVTIWYH